MSPKSTEIASKAEFDIIRYAQVWEDADILLEGLDIQPGDQCLSIASAGENALAMLTKDPAKVIAVDLNPSQLACVELRVAAYKCLQHKELLQLIGSRPCDDRMKLFNQCREHLSKDVDNFWLANPESIKMGIGSAGKFERYFKLFRSRIIPFIHTKKRVKQLLAGGNEEQCKAFYDQNWNNLRWRLLFKVFFSRWMMGRFGRDPAFFNYVEGSVAERILGRTRHALRELNPADNPYLHWIMTGTHGQALPCALREENFEIIRERLDRLEWRLATIESVLEEQGPASFDRYNLSDIFEYMSEEATNGVLEQIIQASRPGARIAYWNMLVPRFAPESWSDRIKRHKALGDSLLLKDKAFFYSAFIIEEVL